MAESAIPRLVTDRLIVTLPARDDAARMVAFYQNNREHLDRWSPPYPAGFFTDAYWRERIAAIHQEYHAGVSVRFVLVQRDEPKGTIVGNVNFSQIARGPFQACYLGYGLAHSFEGRGYMFEALVESIRYVFDDLRLHRIMANYIPTNERSGRLLRRLGFSVEGYARDYLYIDGAWRDHVLTSLTNQALERPHA